MKLQRSFMLPKEVATILDILAKRHNVRPSKIVSHAIMELCRKMQVKPLEVVEIMKLRDIRKIRRENYKARRVVRNKWLRERGIDTSNEPVLPVTSEKK